MTDWGDIRPDLTGDPAALRAEFEAVLTRIEGPGPYSYAQALVDVMLAGKFRREVWPDLTQDERDSYQTQLATAKAKHRAERERRHKR
jgi:hypothetical protein